MKLNNKLISRVYDYRNSFQMNNSISYKRKMDDSDSLVIHPPLEQKTLEYIFKNSSIIRKCSDILSKDILYNNISVKENDSFDEWYRNNKDELYYMGVDYYASGYAVCIILDDDKNIQQIPSVSCVIIQENNDYYMRQIMNGHFYHYNIHGVTKEPMYEESVCIVGGDNYYSFYSLPKFFNVKEEVLADILISERNFKRIEDNFIPNSLLRFNIEPNINSDDNIEAIIDELKTTTGGTSVLFTENENNQPIDYINLEDSTIDDVLKLTAYNERSILNVYNIPLERLLINEGKESMNSNKFENIWEIYIANLRSESSMWGSFISDLLEVKNDEIVFEFPLFTDKKATELKAIIELYNNDLIPYNVAITMLKEYYPDIDIEFLETSFKDMLKSEITSSGSATEDVELDELDYEW